MPPFELTPKQEKAKRARLWKCYRWTLEMYNALGRITGMEVCGLRSRSQDNAFECGSRAFHDLKLRTNSYMIIARKEQDGMRNLGWRELIDGALLWVRTKIEADGQSSGAGPPSKRSRLPMRGPLCWLQSQAGPHRPDSVAREYVEVFEGSASPTVTNATRI